MALDKEESVLLDTSLDMRADARGKDPDTHSPTLRAYHRALWSKALPNGTAFTLEPSRTAYLHHRSEVGEFWLSSDSVIQTSRDGSRSGIRLISSRRNCTTSSSGSATPSAE